MEIKAIDHIALVVTDPLETCAFYEKVLGLRPVQGSNGIWALKFGRNKLSLQVEGQAPEIAWQTTRGSANFCLLTDTPIHEVVAHLQSCGVNIVAGPGRRIGATGPLMSVYFYDLDGNLVEVANQLDENANSFTFREMDAAGAREIVRWQYEPPYDVYNGDPENIENEIQGYLDPQYQYHTVWDEAGEFVGYCCFGTDAQVPGGDYSVAALDVGAGLRPDRTGQGMGGRFLVAVLAFAQQQFGPPAFRATVAAFNQRALRACEKVGFRPVQKFTSTHTGKPFIILMRDTEKMSEPPVL